MITFLFTDGWWDGNSVACATVFPLDTVISMIFPDSASMFTVEVWAVINEQITVSVASKYFSLETYIRVSKLDSI